LTSWEIFLRSTNSGFMKLADIKEILKAQVLAGEEKLDSLVAAGAASDLMSDMLRGPTAGALLLTGLNNIQVIRTSIISGVAAVVLVRGKTPTTAMIRHAVEHDLPLLSTPYTMYSACGRLFQKGLHGVEPRRSKDSSEEKG
jgi:predicted transcriptional regulator